MGWTKILDDYSGGAAVTDAYPVSTKDWVNLVVTSSVFGTGSLALKGRTKVPDSSDPPVLTEISYDIFVLDPEVGQPVAVAIASNGFFRLPCPGDFIYLSLSGGTTVAMNIWAF